MIIFVQEFDIPASDREGVGTSAIISNTKSIAAFLIILSPPCDNQTGQHILEDNIQGFFIGKCNGVAKPSEHPSLYASSSLALVLGKLYWNHNS